MSLPRRLVLFFQGYDHYLAIVDFDSNLPLPNMRWFSLKSDGFVASTADGGSMFGQACASKAISVAAMDWVGICFVGRVG